MVLINPDALDNWQSDETRELVYRDIFEHEQMVNRPAGIVDTVYIAGEMVWDGVHGATDVLGKKPLGKYLRSAGADVIREQAEAAA